MEWVALCFILAVILAIGYRKSLSEIFRAVIDLIDRISVKKAFNMEFEQSAQLQAKNPDSAASLPATEPTRTDDPVLNSQLNQIRTAMSDRPKSQDEKEWLLHTLAVWTLMYRHERVARFIFGSQLELLRLLIAKQTLGGSLSEVKALYDQAVASFPQTYASYSFEQWMLFLQRFALIEVNGNTVTATPNTKAFFHYLVSTNDTGNRPN